MDEKNRYDVIIGGELMTLVASESKEYIDKLVEYLNQKITEIRKSMAMTKIASQTKMLLILINVADDYFKELEKNTDVKHDLANAQAKIIENDREINKLKSNINTLTKKVTDLEKQLIASRNELNEYIEAFDGQVKK